MSAIPRHLRRTLKRAFVLTKSGAAGKCPICAVPTRASRPRNLPFTHVAR